MNMVQVDAYWVAEDAAAQYIEDRERCALALRAELEKRYPRVARCFKGTEDGEAICGIDDDGEIACLFHLDPGNVAAMTRAIAAEALAAFVEDAL